jgi:hypothetical protein
MPMNKSILPNTLRHSLLALLMLLASCASGGGKLLPPVGPANLSSGAPSGGYLLVYSATEEHNDGGLMYYPHTSYRIYSQNGRYLKAVHNHISLSDELPEPVLLQSGQYMVHATSEVDGPVIVPVIIASGRTTVVNLEGNRRGG